MRYLDEAGSTRPASRLTSMSARPSVSRRRWAQTSARASRHAAESDTPFFFGASIETGNVLRRTRSPVPRPPELM